MLRRKWRWGHKYTYIPKYDLVKRLANELNMSDSEIRDQIAKERTHILEHGVTWWE
jgi:hypothetical protein